MNEHEKIQAQLAVYATLELGEHQQIEQHLIACSECTDTLAAYQKMDQALHQFATNKARYLATQPFMPLKPIMPQSSSEHWLLRPIWVEQLLERFIRQPALVLQLAGASVLLLLLIMMSLLLTGWQPNERHLLASTPVVVEPTATATPANPGVWGHRLAVVTPDNGEASSKQAGDQAQIAEATLAQIHFAWRWDNVVDQASALSLPKRNSAAPWDAIAVTRNV